MPKYIFNILLISTILVYINSECSSTDEVKKKKECNKRELSSSEKSGGGYKCCYVNSKIKSGDETTELKYCYTINENDYKNITKFVDDIKNIKGVKKYSIECYSKYLKYLIMNFLIIIFFTL